MPANDRRGAALLRRGAALPDLFSQPGSRSKMSRGQKMWVTLVSPRPIPFGAILWAEVQWRLVAGLGA